MKKFEGKVISDKMNKAAVIEIELVKKHPLYKKRLIIKRKIHAQNIIGAKVGDLVKICEVRPVSKTIFFSIVEIASEKSKIEGKKKPSLSKTAEGKK